MLFTSTDLKIELPRGILGDDVALLEKKNFFFDTSGSRQTYVVLCPLYFRTSFVFPVRSCSKQLRFSTEIMSNRRNCRFILSQASCEDMENDSIESNSNNSIDDFVVDDNDPIEVSSGPSVVDISDDSTSSSAAQQADDALLRAIDEVRTEIYEQPHDLSHSDVIDLWDAHMAMVFHYSCQLAGVHLTRSDVVSRNQRLIGMHMFRARTLAQFAYAANIPEWLAKMDALLYTEQSIGQDINRTGDFQVQDDRDN